MVHRHRGRQNNHNIQTSLKKENKIEKIRNCQLCLLFPDHGGRENTEERSPVRGFKGKGDMKAVVEKLERG